jgi:hypothetical protein
VAVETLLAQATEGKVLPMVEVCRKIGGLWRETRGPQYGGSFLYWKTNDSGKNRSLFGMVPAGKDDPVAGELDVHVKIKNLSEICKISEAEIRETLKSQHPVKETADDCWFRLKSVPEAQAIVDQLFKWASQAAGAAQA